MSLENIHPENLSNINTLDPIMHKKLDLIRRLENLGFIFAINPKVATEQACSSDGTPTDKLIYRASLMDGQGKLQSALHKGDFWIKGAGRLYAGISFVVGFIGVFGLLSTHVINFFYVLLGLLGWHTLTLVLWLIGLNSPSRHFGIYDVMNWFRPKSVIDSEAFDIYQEEFQQNPTWQIGKIIHRAWLFGLTGSLLALLMLFLFKSYAFVWESTLLSQHHFAMILKGLGFLPGLFGFELPNKMDLPYGDIPPARLAMLMILSVVVYGMIPRLCAYLLCHINARERFSIDLNLYYYQNLLRTFNQSIVDKDDYTPRTPKPSKTVPSTHKKIVATLEWASDDALWHGLASDVKNLGAVDTKEDVLHLTQIANVLHAQILLGVDCRILPDRGVLRKVDLIHKNSDYGMIVKFLHGDGYIREWQDTLNERNIEQLN